MMRTLFFGCLCLILTSGCAFLSSPPEHFFAVSSTTDPTKGGIYTFVEGDAHYFRPLPTMSYMITSPDGRYFYCIASKLFQNNAGGVLVLMQLQNQKFVPVGASEAGRGACHLTLSSKEEFCYVANYTAGSITELRLDKGVPVKKRDIVHKGKGDPNSKRQNAPHPHYVGFDPKNENLFVVDLGLNEIWRYPFSGEKGIPEEPAEKIPVHKGAGPRHLVFSPEGQFFYTSNELDSTLSIFENFGGEWREVSSVPTRKEKRENANYPGTLRITGNGRFIFLANRGDNNIVLFEVLKDHRVVKLSNTPCGLFPNDLELTPDEKYFAVSNFFGGTVEFFGFNEESKKITPETKSYPVPSAIKVVFPKTSTGNHAR